jgi:hypothetical protein
MVSPAPRAFVTRRALADDGYVFAFQASRVRLEDSS